MDGPKFRPLYAHEQTLPALRHVRIVEALARNLPAPLQPNRTEKSEDAHFR